MSMLNRIFNSLIALLLIFVANSAFSKDEQTPLLQNQSADFGQPIVLETQVKSTKPVYEDFKDFYILSDGSKKSFLRKKNHYIFISNSKENRVDSFSMKQSINAQFGSDAEVLDNHSLGKNVVVKINNESRTEEIINTLSQSSTSGTFVSPILTTSSNSKELGVTPQIIIQLATDADTLAQGDTLLSSVQPYFESLGLTLERKINFTKGQYLLNITETIYDINRIFELTRELAENPNIKWAEPNFYVSMKPAFTPNDPMYPNQWHLNNTGQNSGVVDADIDAQEAWNTSQGSGAVVAIHDDGVDLTHEDFTIWTNPGESGGGKETNGIDDDANGYIDDYRGWDFTDNDNNTTPAPGSTDNHGTACAGVAAATGNNGVGVAGSAFSAKILPVRMTSGSCDTFGESIRYAGKYADVVSCSWGIDGCNSEISSAIADVTTGAITGARRGTKGSPVVVATGNAAGGWRKFTLNGIPAGTSYTYQWKYIKDNIVSQGFDTVWLDNIQWPDGTIDTFDGSSSLPAGYTTSGNASWTIVSDGIHARGATGRAAKAGTITDSQETSLLRTRTDAVGGALTFWHWTSSELNYDFFELWVGGTRYFQFSPGQYEGHVDAVGFPASDVNAIAIGASTDGGPGQVEERSAYSQYGANLDVVACSSGGGQGITTTDRMGTEGYSTTNYTDSFGGTSSATPLVAGAVAVMIAKNPTLTVTEVRNVLHKSADKIGPYTYTNERNDFYGYGRVNLKTALATKTLSAAILNLQVVAGQNPAGITTADDINQDGQIGLPEAIDVLKQLSQDN